MLSMNRIQSLTQHLSEIEKKLGYTFHDRSYLTLAFIHRSYINENKMVDQHNERLEFLGDAVLGMLMSDYLYRHFPSTPEGDLSYLRSRLIEAGSCVEYIRSLDIAHYILLGKGEQMNGGRGRDSILADLFEAVIGAIYLDGGVESTRKFIFEKFKTQIDLILKTPLKNWKAILQDFCQKKFHRRRSISSYQPQALITAKRLISKSSSTTMS